MMSQENVPPPRLSGWGLTLFSAITIIPSLIWIGFFQNGGFWVLLLGSLVWGLLWAGIFKAAFSRGHLLEVRDFLNLFNR